MIDVLLPMASFAAVSLCVWALLSKGSLRAIRALNGSQATQAASEENNAALRLYQERLADLDEQRANQLIDQAQYDALKNDLEVDVMSISDATQKAQPNVTSSYALIRYLPLFMLPLIGVLLMVFLSNSEVKKATEWAELKATWAPDVERYFTEKKDIPESKDNLSAQQFLLLTQDYLQRHPNDHAAWYEAGLLHLRHGSPAQALSLFNNARAHEANNPTYNVAYAQALIASGSKSEIAQALTLLQTLLQQLPNHEMVWMTFALAHQKNQDYPASIAAWEKLRALRVANNGSVELVDRYLAAAKAEQKSDRKHSADVKTAAHGVSDTPSDKTKTSTLLNVTVRSADTVRDSLRNGVLFVIVKHKDRPMPIAVRKVTSASWPTTIEFSDADSLMPTSPLSQAMADSAAELEVLARYSFEGVAKASAGDYFSNSAAVKKSANQKLLIDQQVQ
ncbi:MAG: c-type cytochrome biogenesis protein CcmI [Pseudomonadota bacterium]